MIALCPYCGARCLSVRRPQRNAQVAHAGACAPPATHALLDVEVVRAQRHGDLRHERIPALVVFDGGHEVVTPAWLADDGPLVGHRVHRFGCPSWPEPSKSAPIRRFNQQE